MKFLIFILFLFLLVKAISFINMSSSNPITSSVPTPKSDTEINSIPTLNYIDVGIPSFYNDQLTFQPSEPAKISELSLILDILIQVMTTSWDGNPNTPLPLSFYDLDQIKLNEYVTSFTKQDTNLNIPQELEPLYLGQTIVHEINSEIFKAREEFLMYLKSKNIDSSYISEFETTTFPADPTRLTYYPSDNPSAPLTGVSPLKNDPRRLKFSLQTIDIYLPSLLIEKSTVVGTRDPKLLRNIALRNTAYHEFTHVLQTAVDSVNTVSGDKYPTVPITDISKLKYRWGDLATSKYFNASATRESQADGVSFEIVCAVFHFSPIQKQLYWEFLFGRLEPQAITYDRIHSIFEDKYPQYDPFDFPSKIQEDILYKAPYTEQVKSLTRLLDLAELSSYAGYLHPLTDTKSFWEFLETTHI